MVTLRDGGYGLSEVRPDFMPCGEESIDIQDRRDHPGFNTGPVSCRTSGILGG